MNYRTLLYMLVSWRVALFIVALIAPLIVPIFGNTFPYVSERLISSGLPSWVWSWGNFDGVHYLTIAQYGYAAQYTQAFFPLYPILIKAVSFIFLGNYVLAALVLSNLSFMGALFLFFKLLNLEKYKSETVIWTLAFFLLFPYSFFLVSIYNESLFLVFIFASFIAARKRMWAWAGLFGFLASLTRLAGIFLLPALIIEWLIQRNYKVSLSSWKDMKPLLGLLMVPLGLIIYMSYLAIRFGDPLYFVHAQSVFGAQRSSNEIILLPQVLWRYVKIFMTVTPNQYGFWTALWEFGVTALFLAAFIPMVKRIRLSYVVFSALAMILPTLTGTLSSMPRYTIVSFALFPILAMLPKALRVILLVVFGLLLILFTILYTRGYWVS